MESKDRFGINMKQYCRDHEAAVVKAIEEGGVTQELVSRHMLMIERIQHERLIHLIVTALVAVCELFVIDLALLHPDLCAGAAHPMLGLLPAVIMLALAVLLGFYFYHYFFLENTVQRWYRLADEMQ